MLRFLVPSVALWAVALLMDPDAALDPLDSLYLTLFQDSNISRAGQSFWPSFRFLERNGRPLGSVIKGFLKLDASMNPYEWSGSDNLFSRDLWYPVRKDSRKICMYGVVFSRENSSCRSV